MQHVYRHIGKLRNKLISRIVSIVIGRLTVYMLWYYLTLNVCS